MFEVPKTNRYFQFKFDELTFRRFKDVRDIVNYCENLTLEERKKYIEDKNIFNILKKIYWLKIYKTEEDMNDAQDIVNKTFSRENDYLEAEEFLKRIYEECEKKEKPYLYNIIINTCPNGSGVVKYVVGRLVNE